MARINAGPILQDTVDVITFNYCLLPPGLSLFFMIGDASLSLKNETIGLILLAYRNNPAFLVIGDATYEAFLGIGKQWGLTLNSTDPACFEPFSVPQLEVA